MEVSRRRRIQFSTKGSPGSEGERRKWVEGEAWLVAIGNPEPDGEKWKWVGEGEPGLASISSPESDKEDRRKM